MSARLAASPSSELLQLETRVQGTLGTHPAATWKEPGALSHGEEQRVWEGVGWTTVLTQGIRPDSFLLCWIRVWSTRLAPLTFQRAAFVLGSPSLSCTFSILHSPMAVQSRPPEQGRPIPAVKPTGLCFLGSRCLLGPLSQQGTRPVNPKATWASPHEVSSPGLHPVPMPLTLLVCLCRDSMPHGSEPSSLSSPADQAIGVGVQCYPCSSPLLSFLELEVLLLNTKIFTASLLPPCYQLWRPQGQAQCMTHSMCPINACEVTCMESLLTRGPSQSLSHGRGK